MATYFVRIGGNDASAGTSAATAWRTLGKALGATGIASGDTCWVGAGVYREAVTVAMTSATVETVVQGDVDGAQTGDAGEVIWTNYLNGWHETPSASAALNLSGRDFLTFRNIGIITGAGGACVNASTVHSSDIKFDTCLLVGNLTTSNILVTASFATALNWTISRCLVWGWTANNLCVITLTTGSGADFDANVQITDSVFWSVGAAAIQVIASGALANKGGGVDVARCTISGNIALIASGTALSTTIPCTVQDCLLLAGTSLSSGAAGQLSDLGGNVCLGTLTSVTQHATTKTSADRFPALLLSFAHEWMWGMQPRRFLAPMFPPILSRGTIGTATTDWENRARPEGVGEVIDSGTATTTGSLNLTDSSKAWRVNEHVGRLCRTTGGTGAGQVKRIISNTATVLTISGGGLPACDGNWTPAIASGTTYLIYDGPPSFTATASAGTTTTFTGPANFNPSVNKWAGYDLKITAGTNSGVTRSIVSNTSSVLTTAAFPAAIDATSVGEIFWPGTSLTATQRTPGALELHDDADRETTTTDAGGVGIHLDGPASHQFQIPVDAVSTTISVKMRYNADHGTTNKPQAILVANGEIGITTQTVTMTAAVDTWENLAFSAITPTAKGVVTVRLVSRSAAPYGRCYADTWSVT